MSHRNTSAQPVELNNSSRGGGPAANVASAQQAHQAAQSAPGVHLRHYKFGRTLGHGAFGKVKLARHVITGLPVAIKIINWAKVRSAGIGEKVKREIQVLMMVKHPHIIRLYEVIESPTEIFLVMEYVPGGELFDHIVTTGKLREEDARRLFQQIISALAYCHHHRVVHRDLKPENLLLSAEGTIKVADFGLSNLLVDGEFLRTSCGSPNYAAPEVISGNLYVGPEVDCWSAGVILYALLCASLPFDDDVIGKLFKKIKAGKYQTPSYLSDDSKDLIKRMICVDPTQRISLAGVMEHPWFKYRLPAYLSVSPAHRKAAQRRAESELDEDAVDELLGYEALRGLQQNKSQIMAWLRQGGSNLQDKRDLVANGGPTAAISPKALKALWVSYELVLDTRTTRSNALQQQNHASPDNIRVKSQRNRALLFSRVADKVRKGEDSDQASISLVVQQPPSVHEEDGHPRPPKEAGSGGSTPPHMFIPPSSVDHMRPPVGTHLSDGTVYGLSSRRSWYLGIQSRKDPAHVMAEVFRALRGLKCEWSVVTPYRLLCRWKPNCCGLSDFDHADEWIYVGLQVYKIASKIYLLDFQRVGSYSSVLAWMNLCTLIINALKPPSRGDRSAVGTTAVSSSR